MSVANALFLLRVELVVEFGAGEEGLEVGPGEESGADDVVVLDAELEIVGAEAPVVGDLDGLEFVGRDADGEAAGHFHGGSLLILVEFLQHFQRFDGFLDGVAEGKEEFVERVDMELNEIIANAEIAYREKIVIDAFVFHPKDLEGGCIVSVRLDFDDFQARLEKGALGKCGNGQRQGCQKGDKSFHIACN